MEHTIHQRVADHFNKLKDHPSKISIHNCKLLVPTVIWELLNDIDFDGMEHGVGHECFCLPQMLKYFEGMSENKIREFFIDNSDEDMNSANYRELFSFLDKFAKTSNNDVMLPIAFSSFSNLEELKKAVVSEFVRLAEGLQELGPNHTTIKVAKYAKLHIELREYKDEARPIVDAARLDGQHGIISEFEGVEKTIKLIQNSDGCGGSYFGEIDGEKEYIVKPVDEEIGAFNNRKGLVSTVSIKDDLATSELSTYRAPLNDMMIYDLACIIGVGNNVPETAMMMVTNEDFHDVFKKASEEDLAYAIEHGAGPDDEKLCTVQRFVKNSKPLMEVSDDLWELIGDSSALCEQIDQDDFENLNILTWLGDERDGNFGNILATVKGIDEQGRKQYGLVKIDSTFSFPRQNGGYGNMLVWLSSAEKKLSQRAIDLVNGIDEAAIIERMQQLGFPEDCQKATSLRIRTLKDLMSEDLTIREINQRLISEYWTQRSPEESTSTTTTFSTQPAIAAGA